MTEPTANDAGDADGGANRGQNFPTITAATPAQVDGALNSEPSRNYDIAVYSGTSCDQAERGRTPIAATTVTTDAAGDATFSVPVAVTEGSAVSALATDADFQDTSQMGSCLVAETPDPTPTPSPSPVPTASPAPSATPSAAPVPSPTPSPTAAPAGDAPSPQPNRTVVVRPVKGLVRVKVGGVFVELEKGQSIPVGSVIDTTKGRVGLTAAQGPTGLQSAIFHAGRFKVGQKQGVTTLKLQGKVGPCPKRTGKASAARKKRKKRKLWGDGSGSFSTKGRYGSATVRGTRWLTQDTCKGTKVTVRKGSVALRVIRGPSKGRTTTVKAPGSKLVKAPK